MPTLYFRHTSKSRFKCINTFINVFLLILIQLFNNGLFQTFEIGYLSASVYILLQDYPDPKIYWI